MRHIMPIESPQHRPPHDLNCPMLQIATGCSHGKCHFCDIFTGVPFSQIPMDEVIADIEEIAKSATALTRRIYLTGGNPFALPTHKLIEVFNEVESRIPTVKGYGGFCRITDIAHKTDEELKLLASRGVDEITIGAESGFDEALEFMEKGHTSKDLIEQGRRLHEAGIKFTFFYLAGMAGKGQGQQNAMASAKVFNEARPSRILVVTLTPTKNWPLKNDIESGAWQPETEVETAREIQTLVANLECECNVNCSHDTDIIRFEGMIPKDRENMVLLMDNLIPKMNEGASRRMRERLHGATF